MKRKKEFSLVPLTAVHEGTKLVTDDGFTCMPDHATRTVKRDRSRGGVLTVTDKRGRVRDLPMNSRGRLYVTCAEDQHFLDGQECGAGEHGMKSPHYVGFWIKGTEPKKEAKT